MRCKNCGTENDDSRYICEICGSPLYDEDEIAQAESDTVQAGAPTGAPNGSKGPHKNESGMDDKTKKSIILIAVLCIVLVIIIAVTAFAVRSGKKEPETTDPIATSETEEDSSERTTRRTTTERTTKKVSTTESTTKKPATNVIYNVYIKIGAGKGSVSGDGAYTEGERAAVVAIPASGYTFDGWYENGNLVETATRYTFKVTNSAKLVARFSEIETEPPHTEAPPNTQATASGGQENG